MNYLGWPIGVGVAIFFAAAGVVTAAHFLKVRSKPMTVPTLLFWRELRDIREARTLGNRFQHWKTWAMWLLLAALVAIALVQPSREASVRHRVLVVDLGSGAMARHASERTVARARQDEAKALLAAWPLADRQALVLARGQDVQLFGYEASRKDQLAAIDLATAASTSTNLEQLLELVSALRPVAGSFEGVVWTDRPEWASACETSGLAVRRLGHEADDGGIIDARFEPPTLKVLLAGHERRLHVGQGPDELAVVAMGGTGDPQWVSIELPQLNLGARLDLRLEPADQGPENDVWTVDLAPLIRARVRIDENCPAWLRSLLEAAPRLDIAPLTETTARLLRVVDGPTFETRSGASSSGTRATFSLNTGSELLLNGGRLAESEASAGDPTFVEGLWDELERGLGLSAEPIRVPQGTEVVRSEEPAPGDESGARSETSRLGARHWDSAPSTTRPAGTDSRVIATNGGPFAAAPPAPSEWPRSGWGWSLAEWAILGVILILVVDSGLHRQGRVP